ncbi:40S ribosomal protein S20-2 [Sesamum angolense]|uniref:40S ribosomal protein S20-2 n=1 Tax=Sesamum angolense TaxID=2727404 RepID=A0AAE1W1P8_9LAMI|nr:40S ribosomal protein S20-2 [Sesamum angolense]
MQTWKRRKWCKEGFAATDNEVVVVVGYALTSKKEKPKTMAYAAMKPTKPGLEESQEQIHKIRITLSSKNVKNLEKVCTDFGTWCQGQKTQVKDQ